MSQSPGCVVCEGTVAPGGHCWDCGADRPDVRGLVGHALDRDGHDNVTALLLPAGTRCP